MKNIKNKLKKAGLASAIALSLAGCIGEPDKEYVHKTGTFEGYDTIVRDVGDWRNTRIKSGRYFVLGKDTNDGDSTTVDIYEISMVAPKGHPLTKYASREVLDEATRHTLETGQSVQ